MQDFTNYINSQLVLGHYRQNCVVNIDETIIFFDMEGGLTLAEKGDKTVSLKTTGTSMRCTVLIGVTMNGEKLARLVVFKGKPDGRIARNFGGMPASMRYICQDKAWVDHRVFKNWIDQVWAPFALEKGDNTYLMMDEFSVHLMASCSNQIKGCGTTIDYILGGYTSKLQVMDVGVNKPFKGYVRQAYENFMIGNIENRKVRREGIVQWIEIGWG
jgi:DDE superfamily endonuclease